MIEIDGKQYRNLEEQVDYLSKHSGDYDSKIAELTTKVNGKCDKTYVDNKVPDTDKTDYVLTSDGTNKNKWTEKDTVKANVAPDATEILHNLKVGTNKYKVVVGSHTLTITDELPEGEVKRAKYLIVDDTFNYAIGKSAEDAGDYNLLNNKPSIGGVEVISSKTLDEYNIYSKDEVNQLIAQISQIIKVDVLPAAEGLQPNTLYYVGTEKPYSIYLSDKDKVTTFLGTTDIDLSEYQKKTDNDLETESKSIVGAINELKNKTESIDGKTIIRNTDGKLQTAVGGYDGGDIAGTVVDGHIYIETPSLIGETGITVEYNPFKIETNTTYSGYLKSSTTTTEGTVLIFSDKEAFVGSTPSGTQVVCINVGMWTKAASGLTRDISIYLGYDTATNKNIMYSKTVDLTNEEWTAAVVKLANLKLTKKQHIISYIDNKYVKVDNSTIKVNENNELSAVAGTVMLQTMYDLIFPVGYKHIGFSAPVTPTGVTATWMSITDFDGKYLKLGTFGPGGTSDESVTVGGTALTIEQMPEHSHGCENGGWHQHSRTGYWTVSYVGDTKRECVSRYQSAGGSIDYDTGGGTHSHTIKKNGSSKAHTHTVKDINPAALCVGLYQRIS